MSGFGSLEAAGGAMGPRRALEGSGESETHERAGLQAVGSPIAARRGRAPRSMAPGSSRPTSGARLQAAWSPVTAPRPSAALDGSGELYAHEGAAPQAVWSLGSVGTGQRRTPAASSCRWALGSGDGWARAVEGLRAAYLVSKTPAVGDAGGGCP